MKLVNKCANIGETGTHSPILGNGKNSGNHEIKWVLLSTAAAPSGNFLWNKSD